MWEDKISEQKHPIKIEYLKEDISEDHTQDIIYNGKICILQVSYLKNVFNLILLYISLTIVL